MSDINDALVAEIYQRDGAVAAIEYLLKHEGLSEDVANEYLTKMSDGYAEKQIPVVEVEPIKIEIKDDTPADFPHHCMFCNEGWVGAEGSLCPKCGTDGVDRSADETKTDTTTSDTLNAPTATQTEAATVIDAPSATDTTPVDTTNTAPSSDSITTDENSKDTGIIGKVLGAVGL